MNITNRNEAKYGKLQGLSQAQKKTSKPTPKIWSYQLLQVTMPYL